MLLKAILVPLSAILAVVSALPTGADVPLQAEAELEARGDLPSTSTPGGYEDVGEIIDITSWVASNVPDVSPRSDEVFARGLDLNSIKCGTGMFGSSKQFREWFKAAGTREICMQNGQEKTWVDGRNRFKVANRSGSLRCNKFKAFETNAYQLGSTGASKCKGSCWAKDQVFPGQTFSLYAV